MQTILIVEDEEVLRQEVAILLTLVGYEVYEMPHGHATLSLIAENEPHWTPDLILCGILIGPMGVGDFYTAVRNNPRLKDIPFVFVCSNHVSASALRALGISSCLRVPLAPEELLKEISDQLKKTLKLKITYENDSACEAATDT